MIKIVDEATLVLVKVKSLSHCGSKPSESLCPSSRLPSDLERRGREGETPKSTISTGANVLVSESIRRHTSRLFQQSQASPAGGCNGFYDILHDLNNESSLVYHIIKYDLSLLFCFDYLAIQN